MNVNVGDTIIILSMQGEPEYSGKSGIVKRIDSLGQVHGTWGGLAVIPEIDEIQIIEGDDQNGI